MPAPDAKEDGKQALLQFIFDSHLSLCNTRRDHEWRVITSAMILMGAVDAPLLTQRVTLTERQEDLWWSALLLLFLSIGWYQWGSRSGTGATGSRWTRSEPATTTIPYVVS